MAEDQRPFRKKLANAAEAFLSGRSGIALVLKILGARGEISNVEALCVRWARRVWMRHADGNCLAASLYYVLDTVLERGEGTRF